MRHMHATDVCQQCSILQLVLVQTVEHIPFGLVDGVGYPADLLQLALTCCGSRECLHWRLLPCGWRGQSAEQAGLTEKTANLQKPIVHHFDTLTASHFKIQLQNGHLRKCVCVCVCWFSRFFSIQHLSLNMSRVLFGCVVHSKSSETRNPTGYGNPTHTHSCLLDLFPAMGASQSQQKDTDIGAERISVDRCWQDAGRRGACRCWWGVNEFGWTPANVQFLMQLHIAPVLRVFQKKSPQKMVLLLVLGELAGFQQALCAFRGD